MNIATVFEMSYPNQTVIVALLVSVIAPSILAIVNHWSRQREKKLDWKREDDKEKKSILRDNEVARRLLESNANVAKTAKSLDGKIDVIHTLVDGNMTTSMRNELEATVRELALMKQIVERDRADGRPILPEAFRAIEQTGAIIQELSAALHDRLEQVALSEKQINTAEKEAKAEQER